MDALINGPQRRKATQRGYSVRDEGVRRSNKAMPNRRVILSQVAVAAFCLLATISTAHAVLLQVLAPSQLPQISSRKGAAKASADAVLLAWTKGIEGAPASTAWVWTFATTSCVPRADGGQSTGAISAHADSLCGFPPGFAVADAFARVNPPRINPTADASFFAASRARAGIGARAASAGDSMAGLIRFTLASLTVDPLPYPPTYPSATDPEAGGMPPAMVEIVGSMVANDDLETAINIFGVRTTLNVLPGGILDLVVEDSTGTLSESDFEFFSEPDGAGFRLSNPKDFSVPFSIDHDFADGTPMTLDLSLDAIARANTVIPEPGTLLLLTSGLVGLLGYGWRRHQTA